MAKARKPGQPSSYKPEYCQAILDYFGIEPYREVMKTIVTKSGDVIKVPENEANDIPNFAGFAASIETHRETILNWTKAHPDFFDAFKRAKELQENFIVINGNKGLLNPAFAIFTAKNVLKWRDKQPDEDQPTQVTVNVSNDLIERIKSEIKSRK